MQVTGENSEEMQERRSDYKTQGNCESVVGTEISCDGLSDMFLYVGHCMAEGEKWLLL